MPKARRIARTTALTQDLTDFSGGIRGGISDVRAPVRHVRLADNAIFDKRLGAITARLGYRDVLAGVLPAAGHSLMASYGVATNRYFVGDGTAIHEIVDGGAYTAQSLPVTPSSSRWSVANLNGALVAAQEGGAALPLAFNGDWYSFLMPAPGTPTFNADSVGGAVDAGGIGHIYRLRHRFKNGSSLAGTPTAARITGGGNLTVNLTMPAVSSRTDYLGWTLERTKLTDATLFYWVADGTAATYADPVSDAALSLLIGAEPGVHGAPPHLEGLVAFRNRLIGWDATTLYVSQEVADAAEASGIYNFNALSAYPVEKDDGDAMRLCIVGGDRVVIFKRSSIHVLEGTDPTNYVRRRLPGNVGCASTRGAALVGTTIYFYGGDQQFYRLDGDKVAAIGQVEMRHYFEQMDVTKDADVVCWDHERGRYFCAACTFTPESYNNHVLAYRTDYRHWTHWKDLRISDVLVPKKIGAFASAKLLFADPLLMAPTSQLVISSTDPSFPIWWDARAAAAQFYVQKLSSTGAPAWTPSDGVQVDTAAATTTFQGAACIPDGSGGIIVAYIHGTDANGRIRAQRFNSAGAKQWGASGTTIDSTTSQKGSVSIASDGIGGAVVAWTDKRGGSAFAKVFVQRVNSAGAVQWTADGVAVYGNGTSNDVRAIQAMPAGAAITYLCFYDTATIRVARITAAGALDWGGVTKLGPSSNTVAGSMALDLSGNLWLGNASAAFTEGYVSKFLATDGTQPFAAVTLSVSGSPQGMAIVSDAANGVIAAWRTYDPVDIAFVYAQRIGPTGSKLWAAGNVLLLGQSGVGLRDPIIVQDGQGGAIVVWNKYSLTGAFTAQRLNSAGAPQWGPAGREWRNVGAVAGSANDLVYFAAASDGGNGVVVAWQDDRPSGNANDLYVQRIYGAGTEAWLANGVAICSQGAEQRIMAVAFTGAESRNYPSGTSSGYHVWAGLEGFKDAIGVDGSGGTTRAFRIETPDSDDMQEDVEKDYDRTTLLIKSGVATLNVGLLVDEGAVSVSVAVPVYSTGKRWGSVGSTPTAQTLYWNQGNWGGNRAREFVAPFPAGTIGKKARLTIAADLDDDLVLSGAAIDYEALPDRGY